MCVCVCSAAQSCLTLSDPVDCSPPDSSVHAISQARLLERAAISSSSGSSWPGDQTHVSGISYIGRQILYQGAHVGSPTRLVAAYQLTASAGALKVTTSLSLQWSIVVLQFPSAFSVGQPDEFSRDKIDFSTSPSLKSSVKFCNSPRDVVLLLVYYFGKERKFHELSSDIPTIMPLIPQVRKLMWVSSSCQVCLFQVYVQEPRK